MYKTQTTKKRMYECYGKDMIICIGYADLQYLLKYETACAYTCGVYGWNADLYEIIYKAKGKGQRRAIICTGYRPFGGIEVDYEVVRKYEEKASAIVHNYELPTKQQQAKVKRLLTAFLNKAYKEYNNEY